MKRKRNSKPIKGPLWAADFLPFEHQLEEHLLGQPRACATIAGVMAAHTARRQLSQPPMASRVLIVGPTSSGKSFLADQVARRLNLHAAYANAATIVPQGYRGVDFSAALKALVNQAGVGGVKRAEDHGMLVIDEVDKIILRGRKDGWCDQLQQTLLPVLNGDPMMIESEDGYEPAMTFRTFGTLVFMMGVFNEIPRSAWRSPDSSRTALVRFGFAPEFVSRISHIVVLEQLRPTEIQKLVEREATTLSAAYQSGSERPELSAREVRQLSAEIAKSPYGIRGARMQIHQILFNKAKKDAVPNLVPSRP